MDPIEKQRAHFDGIATKYFESRKNSNHLIFKSLLWDFFLRDNKKLLIKTDLNVLEPMCGYGEGRKIITTHVTPDFKYTGFDYSANLVEAIKAEDPDINISVADVTKFNVEEEFDLIILIGGLHHVYKYTEDVVERLRRALKSGGYLINFEPTHNNWIFRKIRENIYHQNNFFDQETEQGFELDELNAVFKNSGFKLIDQVYLGILAYILYYNPDAFPKLNLGGGGIVKTLFNLEKNFYRGYLARKFSFATLTLWKKE